MINRVTVISSNYPSPKEIGRGAFVENFAKALAHQGIETEVIAPLKAHKVFWSDSNRTLSVHRPLYLSLSNRGPAPLRDTALRIGRATFRSAVARAIRSFDMPPDAFYAHFLQTGAAVLATAPAAIPTFVGVGESQLVNFASKLPKSDLKALATRAAGFICVSEHLREDLIHLLRISPDKVLVEHNGVDHLVFRPRPREEMRHKLGLPLDHPIISIVGNFSSRKGQNRLLEAMQGCAGLRFVFIGKGSGLQQDSRVLFKGNMPPEKVAEYLAASDLFVLPTQAEGCCNAILEASATALPVVSSKLPTIRAQFPHGGAVLVDPNNLSDIREAVLQILANPLQRESLSAAALKSSLEFRINRRVDRMLSWMNNQLSSF